MKGAYERKQVEGFVKGGNRLAWRGCDCGHSTRPHVVVPRENTQLLVGGRAVAFAGDVIAELHRILRKGVCHLQKAQPKPAPIHPENTSEVGLCWNL